MSAPEQGRGVTLTRCDYAPWDGHSQQHDEACRSYRADARCACGRALYDGHIGALSADATATYTPPVPDGRTHYAGCWRTPGHHDCAIAEIERLKDGWAAVHCTIVEARALLGVVR